MKTNHRIVIAALAALAGLTVGAGARAVQAKKAGSNREVIDRWFEMVDSKQTDKFGEVESPDIQMRTPMGLMKGTQGHVQMTKMFATAFPNFKHTVSHCVESGEDIACEGRFTGDNTGPMTMPTGQTVPATNRHVEFDWAGMAKVKGGKVAAVNVYFDNMGFMQQLGLVPHS